MPLGRLHYGQNTGPGHPHHLEAWGQGMCSLTNENWPFILSRRAVSPPWLSRVLMDQQVGACQKVGSQAPRLPAEPESAFVRNPEDLSA